MERLFDVPEELEPMMDHEMSYEILKNALYPRAKYVETGRTIHRILDEKGKCLNIPPVDAAEQLDLADEYLLMPEDIFRFVEKAYRDGYYQLRKHRCAFWLGRLYSEERYGHLDYAEAARWFERGARALDGEAEARLGKCFYLGLGVPVDYQKAYHCLVKWALIEGYGCAEALYLLGDMYFHGHYVDRDEVQAYELYQRAERMCDYSARSFSADVYLRLADYNLNRIDTEESCRKALSYFQYAEEDLYKQRRFHHQNIEQRLEWAMAGQEKARRRLREHERKLEEEDAWV